MSTVPSRAQSKRYAGLLPVDLSIEADPQNDWFQSPRPSPGKQASLTLIHLLIAFFVGIIATSAWQSYGDAAREIVTNSSSHFGWLAAQAAPAAQNGPEMIAPAVPAAHDQQQLNATSRDFDAVRQSVDRIAISQQKITRTVDQVAARQDQMWSEITKLQAISQYILYKNSETPPRPTPAMVPTPIPRPSQARKVR